MDADALARARRVRMMLFDVDGVLTDGTLYIGEHGETMKGFNVRDGHGLKLLQEAGIEVGIVTSRQSAIVARRAEELGIRRLHQGVPSKRALVRDLLAKAGLEAAQGGFMGDDLLDLGAMAECGFAATVPESCEAVRERAHYVSRSAGGRGAVRELCEFLLAAQGKWDEAVRRHLT